MMALSAFRSTTETLRQAFYFGIGCFQVESRNLVNKFSSMAAGPVSERNQGENFFEIFFSLN